MNMECLNKVELIGTVGSVTNRKLAKEQSKSKSKKHDFSDMMPN